MTKLLIRGGRPLRGSVLVGGRKNAVLPLIAATLLAEGTTRLENVPRIHDVHLLREMLVGLGARADWDLTNGRMTVGAGSLTATEVPPQLAGAMRASYYLLGVLLARFGRADVPLPGGDQIGKRPVDQHLKGLAALGAEVWIDRNMMRARSGRLRGAEIRFDMVSVGATIHVMMAATLASGTTVLHNCAREPHVADVATYLNACGARIYGAGTETILIEGVPALNGAVHRTIPDDIEAGTWMIAAAITGGDVTVDGVLPEHVAPITAKLREAGAQVLEGVSSLRVFSTGHLQAVDLRTEPYPGFPTDAQSQFTALMTLATGQSRVTETLYTDRFRFAGELATMGAKIQVDGQTALVSGVDKLQGAPVVATDIRAGAALVLAGLAAEGETTLYGLDHIERGYEWFEQKLLSLGAEVGAIDRQETAVG
ncbi:MAG TPA: UDP-N-acetylglucosamine 1-carboxyvinyltransferase [Symbiobacteriaceae bacterium]|nr:UDP-N-acetylglucosamine 1-carboxyvinyltransferase [Symbiobacteriaceae bacterium]